MAEKSIAEHLEDYKLAEAYDYPRGEVSADGFAKYLEMVMGEVEIEEVQE